MVSFRSVTVGVSRACGKCQVVVRLETDFVEQSHHTGSLYTSECSLSLYMYKSCGFFECEECGLSSNCTQAYYLIRS